MNQMKYILLLFTGLFLACSGSKQLSQPSYSVEKVAHDDQGILFMTLYFEAQKDRTKLIDVEMQWVDGKLKEQHTHEGDMKVIVTGGEEIEEIIFENPLKQIVESYDENGNISKHQLSLEKADITFRLNYDGGPRLVEVYEVESGTLVGQFKLI